MSNKRMAGQSLAARNRAARERLSNNPKTLASRVAKAKSSKYDLSGFSDKEISMAMQGSGFDQFDYAHLTGKPVGGEKSSGSKKPASGGSGDSGSDGGSTPSLPGGDDSSFFDDKPIFGIPVMPTPTPDGDYSVSQIQNVQQDNDINQTIGDNNTVTNNVDNSVSQQNGSYGFLGDFMKKYDFFK